MRRQRWRILSAVKCRLIAFFVIDPSAGPIVDKLLTANSFAYTYAHQLKQRIAFTGTTSLFCQSIFSTANGYFTFQLYVSEIFRLILQISSSGLPGLVIIAHCLFQKVLQIFFGVLQQLLPDTSSVVERNDLYSVPHVFTNYSNPA